MVGRIVGAVIAASVAVAAAPAGAATLELRDVAARVTVIPEDRADISVNVIRTHPRLPIRVDVGGDGRTILDGPLMRHGWPPLVGGVMGCPGNGAGRGLWIWGVGTVSNEDLPVVVVHTPRQIAVWSSGAVLGAVGPSHALVLQVGGCDTWTLGNVDGDLAVRYAGSGAVRAGSAGRADLDIAGSGDIVLGEARNGLTAHIGGSGSVRAASVSGPTQVAISGSGKVIIDGGRATLLSARISGSGEIADRGVAEALDATISGSGNLVVAKVTGRVSKSISGSGKVRIGP